MNAFDKQQFIEHFKRIKHWRLVYAENIKTSTDNEQFHLFFSYPSPLYDGVALTETFDIVANCMMRKYRDTLYNIEVIDYRRHASNVLILTYADRAILNIVSLPIDEEQISKYATATMHHFKIIYTLLPFHDLFDKNMKSMIENKGGVHFFSDRVLSVAYPHTSIDDLVSHYVCKKHKAIPNDSKTIERKRFENIATQIVSSSFDMRMHNVIDCFTDKDDVVHSIVTSPIGIYCDTEKIVLDDEEMEDVKEGRTIKMGMFTHDPNKAYDS